MNRASTIPTTYRGIRFRSRLEARWAVFFDKLKIGWQYEPEAFLLLDGRGYTPDFFLPKFSHGVYAEVRPEGDPFKTPRLFCSETGYRIWLCEGEPRCVASAFLERVTCPDCDAHPREPCRPPEIDTHAVVPLLDVAESRAGFFFDPGVPIGCDFLPWYGDEAGHLVRAAEAARTHRFWDPAPSVSP